MLPAPAAIAEIGYAGSQKALLDPIAGNGYVGRCWPTQPEMAMVDVMGYPGAKTASGVHQAIISQMPPHDCYIETHMGSGFIMRHKPPAHRTIGIDPAPYDAPSGYFPAGAEIICARAESYIAGFDYAGAGRVLLYCDPPYLQGPGEVRGARRLYRHEYSAADHLRLLELLRGLPAAVMISGYPSRLYDDALADWRAIEFQAMTRGGPRTEKLWLNFPAGAVQWGGFAGRNHTQRQHVKRQAARWAAKYAALPPARRLAILAALLAIE